VSAEIIDAMTCKKVRHALRWSPWTLARAAGVSEGYVLDFEAGAGRHRPGMKTALKRALNDEARRQGVAQ
jgi:DNA-binding XRE family transcriptional regulator